MKVAELSTREQGLPSLQFRGESHSAPRQTSAQNDDPSQAAPARHKQLARIGISARETA